MNNSPVKSELYVALENGRINLLLTSYKNLIDIAKNNLRFYDDF